MDFLPSSALNLAQITRPAMRCNGCSGFLNVYCKTNLLKWVWKCNMCGCVNISKEQLGQSADAASYPELCSEAVEYVLPLPDTHLPPPHQCHLVFAVDTSMEPHDLQATKDALLATLTADHLPPGTLVSLVTFDGCVAVHSLGSHRCSHVLPAAVPGPAAAPGASPSAPSPSLDQQAAVQHLLDRHCATSAARGGGGGGDGVLVSELQACAAQLPKVLASLRTVQSDVPLRARARCLCAAVEASLRIIAAHASLDLTRHHNMYGSRVVVLAGGPATRGPGAVPLQLLDQAVPEKGRGPENRIVAAALDVGAALGSMATKIGVAVDIFTSTPTGINARLLTAIAHGSGGELMPQQTSPQHFYPPHHQHSSPQKQQERQQQPSAGDAHGASAAAGGSGSGEGPSGGFIARLLTRQLAAALSRRFGLDGRLDCYCSEGLRLVQWMGPLDPIRVDLEDNSRVIARGAQAAGYEQGAAEAAQDSRPAPPAAAAAGGAGNNSPWRLSSAACGVVALEAGRCASLRLEVTRDMEDVPSLLLQVALHFVNAAARCRIVRVVSRKVQVVESRGEYLRTVNPTAAAALLGKKAVLDAKKAGAFRDSRRAEEARYAVAAQLGLVATRCGTEVQASRGVLGFGARKLRQWPPELMPLAYALYHFQRGPILGPPSPPPPGTFLATAHSHLHALWDSDARLTGINSLLWSAWSDAYRAMAPKLYAVLPQQPQSPGANGAGAAPQPPPQLAALPCVSLAAVMARTVPLLLDVGTAVLVSHTEEPGHGDKDDPSGGSCWLTPALIDAALQAVTAAASGPAVAAAAVGRTPVPSVVLAPGAQAGGGAMSSRLIPVHRDAYEEQALQHPQLQQLGQAVAAQLSKQLLEGSREAAAASASAGTAAGLPPVQAKQAAAAAASFVEWCRGVNVQPFPLR